MGVRSVLLLATLLLASPLARADDHVDDAAGATPLPLGPAGVAGRIDRAGDRDVFVLDARAGERYVVETGQLTAGMDSVIALYGPSGAYITHDDDGAGGLASRIEHVAAQDGPHYVTVVHYSRAAARGGYVLRASGPSATPPVVTPPVVTPPAASGTGELTLDARVFDPKLEGAALEVRSRRDGSGSYAAQLTVRDAQGRVVRALASETRQRGREYVERWDGRDAGGAYAPPGAYTVRLEGGGAAVEVALHVVRLGARAVTFEGAGRVPLAYHRAERWAGSLFPIDNAGAPWTLASSPAGAGCLDALSGAPLAGPSPWAGLDGPPRASNGALLARGRSLPVAFAAGSTPRVRLTLGNAAAGPAGESGCGYPIAGRRLRVTVEGGAAASALSGEIAPGDAVALDLAPLGATLGERLLRLRLRFAYEEPDGSWRDVPGSQTTEHTLYVLHGRPQAANLPGALPWVAALDLAAGWLTGGVTRRDEVLARIVEGVNARLGLRYDMVSGAPAYTSGYTLESPDLDLSAFLDGKAYGSTVNCLDCASLVTILAAQLGVSGEVQILGWNFALNYMRGIGWPDFSRRMPAFSYHAVGTFDRGSTVHDACLSVDDDARPWQAPFVERLPIAMPLDQYRAQLSPDWFSTQGLGRAQVR